MPNLRELLNSWLLRRIGRAGPASPGEADQQRWRSLLDALEERDRLITRLKSTAERRQDIFRKLKRRYSALRRENRLLSKKTTQTERQLSDLRIDLDHARGEADYLTDVAAGNLSRPSVPGRYDPTIAWEQFWFRHFRRLAWRGSMRLGVLFQHAPRPLQWERFPPPAERESALPTVSIVTPSFMQAQFVERTIDSVLSQNYPRLEYVVMDGGSTDGSAEIIARHQQRLHYWQSAADGGHTQAISAGFEKTRGEIMAWLNSDDVLCPGALRFVAEHFLKHPDVDVVYGHRILIDERDREVGRWVLPGHDPEFTCWVDFIPQETLFWRRSAYERAGGMDPQFKFAMDWDLILRLQTIGARFVRLPFFLGAFRVHADQKSITQKDTIAVEENRRLRERELGTAFSEHRLERKVVAFQLKAAVHALLLKRGLRL